MCYLLQYILDNLAFNDFSWDKLKKGTQASKTVLRIFCKFFSVYLATKSSKESIIRSTI